MTTLLDTYRNSQKTKNGNSGEFSPAQLTFLDFKAIYSLVAQDGERISVFFADGTYKSYPLDTEVE